MDDRFKFRYWCLIDNKMSYIDWDDCCAGENMPHPSCGDYELMQSTGMTDKDGKLIYEGDIVLFHAPMEDIGFQGSNLHTVLDRLEAELILEFKCSKIEEFSGFGYRSRFRKRDGSFASEREYYEYGEKAAKEAGERAEEMYTNEPFEYLRFIHYLNSLNAFEVIGNIYENPDLIQPPINT